jgi:HemY protein
VMLLALVAGGIAGTLMVRDPGYVLLVYDDLSLETSLWAALVALLLLYLLVRAVTCVLTWSSRAGLRVRRWDLARRQRRARTLLERGLLQLAEGRWTEARRALLRAVDDSDVPAINLLHAARAAHEDGRFDERDSLLQRARDCGRNVRFAAALTEAELRLDQGDARTAVTLLAGLRAEAPAHAAVLALIAEAFRCAGDWRALLDAVPVLHRHQVLDEPVLRELLEHAWAAWSSQLAVAAGPEPQQVVTELGESWRRIPADLRGAVPLQAYATALVRAGAAADAETLLRSALERHWDETLVRAYAELAGDEIRGRQRRALQGWLGDRPNDLQLRVALGRICLATGAFAEARAHLEAALRTRRSAEVYALLGQVFQRLGEHQRSAGYFALALEPET